jgi:TolB protein
VRADLDRCGMFKIVDGPTPADESGSPDYTGLRSRGADAVASGSATRLADGRIDIRYRLWDVVKGTDLGGMSYPVPVADLRLGAIAWPTRSTRSSPARRASSRPASPS